jgi:WD40 repeat protein
MESRHRKLIATMSGHEGNVWDVAFSPDSTTLAVGTQDGFVQWWDVAHRRLIVQEPGDGTVTNLAFSPDGKVLATAAASYGTIARTSSSPR